MPVVTFFHDTSRNLLIYPLTAGAPLHVLSDARRINGEYFAVPRTLQNSQVLRFYNYPVAPVMDSYDWPAAPGVKPYATQKLAAEFMVLHRRCFNLSDMGVGKTNAALWAADYLMRRHPPGEFRALIVAPLSILERVWADAISKNFLGRRKFVVLYGDAAKRRELLKQNADFYIINFDGVGIGAHTRKRLELDGLSADLAARDDIQLAIVDEASGYRDSQTKRHRIARLVIGKRPYLWLMTGTPTPNSPTDAYGLAKMVNGAFGKSFTTFRQETMVQVTNFKWAPRKDGYDQARRLLSPSIRFDIAQVWDGPPLTVQQREVPLTADQKKMLADLKRDLVVQVKSGQAITATNEAAARSKFIQISLGAIYDAKHDAHTLDASPRVEELRAVIEEAPGKILIFVPLTSVVEMLYRELGPKRDKTGRLVHAGWSRDIVNGNVSQSKRSDIFQAFQSGSEPRLLIADPGTMAHGLDLWAAQTVVWYGPCDRTELYLQANRRAHRPGQVHPVTVVQLVSNALEQEIYKRLETNTTLQGTMLELIRRGEF